MKTLSYVVLFGALGLLGGYLLFGRGVDVMTLLQPPKGLLGPTWDKATGHEAIRQNILIAGGVGALVGLVLSLAGRRPRR
jgi:hypothetical protein